jgi:hypothetical protein
VGLLLIDLSPYDDPLAPDYQLTAPLLARDMRDGLQPSRGMLAGPS